MKKKYKNNKDMIWHIHNIKENGIKLAEDLYVKTHDYELPTCLNTPIKDLKLREIERWKEEDPRYYEANLEPYYENIKMYEVLYGDWWTVLYKNRLYFITISTYDIKSLANYNLNSVISSHFRKVYPDKVGYNPIIFKVLKKHKRNQNKLYSMENKYNTVSHLDFIRDYVDKNPDCEMLNLYKEKIKSYNQKSLDKKHISFYESSFSPNLFEGKVEDTMYKSVDLTIELPLFYDKTMEEVFRDFFVSEKVNSLNKKKSFDEDESLLNSFTENIEEIKEFLSQFIPPISNKKNIHSKKRIFKHR